MKVSVLSSDLSHNCLGRAWVVANLLADRHEVEIVGPVLGADVWEPLRHDTSVAYRPLDRRLPLRRAVAAADGDVLYAVKPKGTSLGRALLARRARRRVLIADVDDWEMAFFLDDLPWMARNMVRLWDPTNVWATWAMERAVASADAVTVSSRWLQQRFGGVVVPHARDGAVLDPAAVDGRAVRDEYGLHGRKVVLFLGSPRPHKGIGTVLEALDRLADPQVVFLVVGVDVALPARDYLVAVAPQPFDRIPAFLAAADVVVLAQHATRAARAQVPAKVFDAMAMGTAVIATAVSDLPDILRRGGVVVPPGDAGELAEALQRLLGDPARTRALGAAGRDDFLSRFSFDALRPVLHGVLDSAVLAAGR